MDSIYEYFHAQLMSLLSISSFQFSLIVKLIICFSEFNCFDPSKIFVGLLTK
jgi:hypothetical protein